MASKVLKYLHKCVCAAGSPWRRPCPGQLRDVMEVESFSLGPPSGLF